MITEATPTAGKAADQSRTIPRLKGRRPPLLPATECS